MLGWKRWAVGARQGSGQGKLAGLPWFSWYRRMAIAQLVPAPPLTKNVTGTLHLWAARAGGKGGQELKRVLCLNSEDCSAAHAPVGVGKLVHDAAHGLLGGHCDGIIVGEDDELGDLQGDNTQKKTGKEAAEARAQGGKCGGGRMAAAEAAAAAPALPPHLCRRQPSRGRGAGAAHGGGGRALVG